MGESGMTRIRQLDILVELIELCLEMVADIHLQITYYRASVYKHETRIIIDDKVARLKMISNLFSDVLLQEPFRDYEIKAIYDGPLCPPGECSYSTRVYQLIQDVKSSIGEFEILVNAKAESLGTSEEFIGTIKGYRQQILNICRRGSKGYDFFLQL